MKKRILALFISSVLVLGILAACGGGSGGSASEAPASQAPAASESQAPASSESAQPEAPAGGNQKEMITIVTETEPDTMDPRRGNSIANNIPMAMIYDGLIRLSPDNEIVPCLGTEWEFIDDTHLRFKLREGVKFSNGQDFTAEDVLYSFERTKHDSTSQSTMSWYDEENSVAEDDYTIVIAMHHPYAPIFNVLSGGRTWIGDKTTMEEVGEEEYARNPIGTGPWVLEDWTSGASMTMARNENYWGEKTKTDKVMLKFIAEPANRVIELETGAADVSLYVSGSDAPRVDAIPGYKVVSGSSDKYYLITMAMDNELLSDEKIRYALSLAIDKEALVERAFAGTAEVLNGVYPSTIEHFKDYGTWEYNPEKAKELLKEAGYENGFDIELHIAPGAEWPMMAQIVQAYWAAIGVNANIETSALATREAQGPWETAIRSGNATEISNIIIIYEKDFGSRLAPNDDYLDGMLQDLKTIYDDKERGELLNEIQDYIWEIRYSIPFAQVDTIFGVNENLEGMIFNGRISSQNIYDWVIYE